MSRDISNPSCLKILEVVTASDDRQRLRCVADVGRCWWFCGGGMCLCWGTFSVAVVVEGVNAAKQGQG